jgi:hypothetical protein
MISALFFTEKAAAHPYCFEIAVKVVDQGR